jgi:hypothetical protein
MRPHPESRAFALGLAQAHAAHADATADFLLRPTLKRIAAR